jgi:hypothetical protein
MNRYILIRRLTGPAILLLLGVVALLHQTGVIDHWFRYFWPLLLILLGVLKLAERAALASEDYPAPYGGYPGGPYAGAPGVENPPASTGTSIVPSRTDDLNGGRS